MRILVFGQGPLPLADNKQTSAVGYRTWHFVSALRKANHEVSLILVNSDEQDLPQAEPSLTVYAANSQKLADTDFLAQICQNFQPDAAIAASIFSSYLSALYLPKDLPLWADFFGSPLAEGQAKAFVHQDDALVEPYARFERVVAKRADKFSAVSSYQKYALIGALATHGRFNQHSYGYEFVETVPAAVNSEILAHTQNVVRGKVVPQEAFVVLWSGGYNTWTDVDTLFGALEMAMPKAANLHFVSVGGAIPNHDEVTYNHFKDLIENSKYSERFHLLGWQPYDILHNFYHEANVGIILDKWSYEGVLGSRTRLLDWLKYGLPAITSVTAELTEILVKAHLAFSFPHGDATALADLIMRLFEQPQLLQEHSKNASSWVLENYSYSKVCQPLVAWAENAQHAPDADNVLDFGGGQDLDLERKLASLNNQLEQKNAHILEVENWARDMEARLKSSGEQSKWSQLTNFLTGRKNQND